MPGEVMPLGILEDVAGVLPIDGLVKVRVPLVGGLVYDGTLLDGMV
jgi:hypothetical protein